MATRDTANAKHECTEGCHQSLVNNGNEKSGHLFMKDQIVKISGFVGHMVSVTLSLLFSSALVLLEHTDNMRKDECSCVPLKLDL